MFFDLSKLGDVVGEALKKAKDDLEKGVDTALGIDGAGKEKLAAETGSTLAASRRASESGSAVRNAGQDGLTASSSRTELTSSIDQAQIPTPSQVSSSIQAKQAASKPSTSGDDQHAAEPAGKFQGNGASDEKAQGDSGEPAPPGKKKIIRKVVKRVVKQPDAVSTSSSQPAQQDATQPLPPAEPGAPDLAMQPMRATLGGDHAQRPNSGACAQPQEQPASLAPTEPSSLNVHSNSNKEGLRETPPNTSSSTCSSAVPEAAAAEASSSAAGAAGADSCAGFRSKRGSSAGGAAGPATPGHDGWDMGWDADSAGQGTSAPPPPPALAPGPATEAEADTAVSQTSRSQRGSADGALNGTAAALQEFTSSAVQPPAELPPVTLPDLDSLDVAQLKQLVHELHGNLGAREQQLVRQALQMSDLQQVVVSVQDRNEELALRSARISEQDLEEMRAEFEARLGAAERKVYALTKERDALKKGTEKLADYGNLLKEKDGIIKQVMGEGEKLASKQADLEATIKKVRAQVKDLEGERDKLAGRLAAEQGEVEAQKKARSKVERDLAAAQEQAKADLEALRQQYDALLQKAKAEQVDAEERAREVASQGLSRRLKESDARGEALTETVLELREALERQRQAADLREEMLKQDIADLERRCQAAELRHQELTSKLPEATRPLLRQIEAMQAAAQAQSEAWSAAEETLNSRIADAEARAATATERERMTADRTAALQTRAAGLEAALTTTRAEVKTLNQQLEAAVQKLSIVDEQHRHALQQVAMLQERVRIMAEQADEAAVAAAEVLAAERALRTASEADVQLVQRECERRVAELEAQLSAAQQQGPGSMGGMFSDMMRMTGSGDVPPAMAAPGYKWVLVKEGEEAAGGAASRLAAAAAVADGSDGSTMDEQAQQQGFGSSVSRGAGLDLLGLSPAPSTSLTSAELEVLRAGLKTKTGELAVAEARIRELQATTDRLAEELVSMAAKSEQAQEVLNEMAAVRKEMLDLKSRYIAAVELLGERDEMLEEMRADLMDVKNLYRDQIEFMVMQLSMQQDRQAPSTTHVAAQQHELSNGGS